MWEKALEHVCGMFAAQEKDHSTRPGQQFRTRSAHTRRVCMWLDRLLAQGGAEDTAAVRLAAVFHDAGRIHGAENHGEHSERILRAYATIEPIPAATVERAAFLVREHSNKARWLSDPHAPRNLILLMEADLLDEEGAMGLALDCMTAGALGLEYEGAYARMRTYEPPRLTSNPMVTPLARQLWTDKQRIIREFMTAFAFDLGEADEA
ncbi:HD domain-containing protein [Eubacteriales bacterium OttesenSCG-928-A19]|nr:HD domain-containing protein [Eubacteriales bacterium OttesenSCG-928-A19]